jgi:hypothetical protein
MLSVADDHHGRSDLRGWGAASGSQARVNQAGPTRWSPSRRFGVDHRRGSRALASARLPHVRLGDWCADLGALTTSFPAGPSIAVGVASSFEGRTGRKGPRPPAQQAVAGGRSRDLQLGTCAHRGAPSFLVVSTISKGFAAERQAVGQTRASRAIRECGRFSEDLVTDGNRTMKRFYVPNDGST